MARGSQRGSYRAAVLRNATQQRSKAANYGHLLLPRGVNVFKEAEGRISLDILPYFVTDKRHPDKDEEFGAAVEGSLWYKRPYRMHRRIGAANTSVVCPSSFGKKCPICEYREEMQKPPGQGGQGLKWDNPSVKALKPSDRVLYYVVPKGSSKHEEKPYIWDMSAFLFQDLLIEELEEDETFADFMLLDNGLTLKLRFSEEKTRAPDGAVMSFVKTSKIEFEERSYEYGEDVPRGLTSLDDCLDAKEYRDIERLFYDTDGEGGGDAVDGDRERVRAEDEEHNTAPAASSLTRPKVGGGSTPTRPRVVGSEPEAEAEAEPEAEQPRRRPASSQVRPPAASEPEKPARTPARSQPKAKEGECPSGYTFGDDVDKYDECAECPVWNDCMDAKAA